MKRNTPLKRSVRIKPKARKTRTGKLGIVRLSAKDMTKLRIDALERSGGFCEMQRVFGTGLNSYRTRCMEPLSWESMELAHIKSRGAGGSDTLDNVLASCKWRRDGNPGCHTLQHAGGKPCPKK